MPASTYSQVISSLSHNSDFGLVKRLQYFQAISILQIGFDLVDYEKHCSEHVSLLCPQGHGETFNVDYEKQGLFSNDFDIVKQIISIL